MWLIYSVFFVMMYAVGWSLLVVPMEYVGAYIIAVYLLVNFFTILNQKLFSISVLKPLQFSYASILVYSFLMDSYVYVLFAFLMFFSFVVMETEDFKYIKNKKRISGLIEFFKMSFMFLILPFSVTYSVMIFRPNEVTFIPVVLIVYFSVLYFSAKYLYAKRLIWIFLITQITGFTYLINRYYAINLMEIMIFVFSVGSFLLINHGRKGLLGYFEK